MKERLADLQREVGITRRRLEDAMRRLAAVQERLGGGAERPAAGVAAPGQAASPLFQGLSGAADIELHFEALDTEDPKDEPKREER
jgi:hypothetical protein